MSVLDDMTKGIMQQKAEKATKLTPIKGESQTTVAEVAAGIPDVPGDFMTSEKLQAVARELRRGAAQLNEVADGIDAMTGESTSHIAAPADTTASDTKAAEKAADKKAKAATVLTPQAQKLVDNMKALQADAEAATYASADAGGDDLAAEVGAIIDTPATGWVCPDHGTEDLTVLTSRKERKYRACQVAGCQKFEK